MLTPALPLPSPDVEARRSRRSQVDPELPAVGQLVHPRVLAAPPMAPPSLAPPRTPLRIPYHREPAVQRALLEALVAVSNAAQSCEHQARLLAVVRRTPAPLHPPGLIGPFEAQWNAPEFTSALGRQGTRCTCWAPPSTPPPPDVRRTKDHIGFLSLFAAAFKRGSPAPAPTAPRALAVRVPC
eukprot:tig00021572_g22392.t1